MSETNKYYCVKNDKGWHTKGKIYEHNGDCSFRYDNGYLGRAYKSWEQYSQYNPGLAACLISLVQRPAKVGEQIRKKQTGEVSEVIALDKYNDIAIYVRTNKHKGYTGAKADRPIQPPFDYLLTAEYEVLKNYRPEPEPPKLEKVPEKPVATLILQQQLEEAKAERDAKDKQIAEIEKQIEKAGKPWKPAQGKVYYFADPSRTCFYDYTTNNHYYSDDHQINAGNCYRTAEEAAEAGKRMYYRAWAESLSDVTEEMWADTEQLIFYASWDRKKKKIDVDWWQQYVFGTPCYTSKDALNAAIATIGEDNWIKYVLGVQR